MPYVEVAVNSTVPHRRTFTYSLPAGLELSVGQAVYVPFGRRTLQGVVLEVTEEPLYPDTRDVIAPMESRPIVSSQRVALARWMSDYYLAPLFDCVALMLSPGSRRKPVTLLQPLVTADDLASLELAPRQRELLEHLVERGRVDLEVLRAELKLRGLSAIVDQLASEGLVERTYELAPPKVRAKVVPHARLLVASSEAKERAEALRTKRSKERRMAAALEALVDEECRMPLSALRSRTRITPAGLRDLVDEGLVAVEDVEVERDPLAARHYPPREPPILTAAQEEAYREIAAALERSAAGGGSSTFLLHGVTGSGKTEVYLQALEKAVAFGKRGIVLVPEISLTPQTIRRFAERFPGQVAVMHSGLSLGEQFDQWRGIRDGHYAVVVGPRSAIFSPQPDLGLIVMDEEHEWTYKQQEPSPRYHARHVAERLAELTGAVLVLGSATPDLESYHRATSGRYRLLELRERLQPLAPEDGGRSCVLRPLPEVEVVDMRRELREGNRSIFSRSLSAALGGTLAAGEQVILFLNRRGAASFVQCRDCGHVPVCSGCSVSLTYHASEGRLICHHCHRGRRLPERCPQCDSPRIRFMGMGTERVQEEAAKAFPQARLLRWDWDVTRQRGAHERILARFLAGEADILIGTQMVAKGLDIPAVTLVGVVSADVSLNLPDYRSGERTFQLLEQVAGRAGRGPLGGRVIIQTYTPQHWAIEAAAGHDYAAFYQHEAALRRRLGYPPFGRLARLIFAHTNVLYAQEQAQQMGKTLRQEKDIRGIPHLDILGPAPSFVPKLRGRHRWQILLRGDDPGELLGGISFPQGWTVDVDPVTLL